MVIETKKPEIDNFGNENTGLQMSAASEKKASETGKENTDNLISEQNFQKKNDFLIQILAILIVL